MDQEELVRRFTYHAPKGDQAEKYGFIREAGRGMAALLVKLCPSQKQGVEWRKVKK